MQGELVSLHGSAGVAQELSDRFTGCDLRVAEVHLVEPRADRIHRMYLQPFSKAWFVADQPPELRSKGIRQSVGESGEQYPGVRIGPGKKDGAMQRDNGLACACRTRNPGWAVVIPLNQCALGWMKE